jgi:hypothetical protein
MLIGLETNKLTGSPAANENSNENRNCFSRVVLSFWKEVISKSAETKRTPQRKQQANTKHRKMLSTHVVHSLLCNNIQTNIVRIMFDVLDTFLVSDLLTCAVFVYILQDLTPETPLD